MREELILKVLAKEDPVVDLAEEYGVARKTIYKWLKRYEQRGLAGLHVGERRHAAQRLARRSREG